MDVILNVWPVIHGDNLIQVWYKGMLLTVEYLVP